MYGLVDVEDGDVTKTVTKTATKTATTSRNVAKDILCKGVSEMTAREDEYDAPGGERSMKATVAMFNAMVGSNLSEGQGWKFMVCLKLVRSEQGAKKKLDSYVDGAAYFALAGETAAAEGGAK